MTPLEVTLAVCLVVAVLLLWAFSAEAASERRTRAYYVLRYWEQRHALRALFDLAGTHDVSIGQHPDWAEVRRIAAEVGGWSVDDR